MTSQPATNPTLQWDNHHKLIIAGRTRYHAVDPADCAAGNPLTPAATSDDLALLYRALNTPGTTPDLVICGDAYDAIEQLTALPSFPAPQLIYIDPPYNTGTIFTDYSDGLDHHLWLGMMSTRLTALHEALAPTGSIWVHLDDSEMSYARVLLDEIFGRENFIAQIIVEINPKGRQLDRFFAACHDYLLVYAKDASRLTLEPGITGSVDPHDFPHQDDEGRYRFLPLRNTNKKFNPVTARTMSYPLYAHPQTGAVRAAPFDGAVEVMPVFGDLQPAVWRWSAATVTARHKELIARQVRDRKSVV